uniref:Putative secreted protein n=1 Tax=Anopheles darlingi TaxID=43151 RepID=A0A2M4DKE9_ANODA
MIVFVVVWHHWWWWWRWRWRWRWLLLRFRWIHGDLAQFQGRCLIFVVRKWIVKIELTDDVVTGRSPKH